MASLAAECAVGAGPAGGGGRRGRRARRGRVPVADHDVHPAVLRPCRLLGAGPGGQRTLAVAGLWFLLLAPVRRRCGVRAAGVPVRAGGPRPRRAGGDVRGRQRGGRIAPQVVWSRRWPRRCASAAAVRSAGRARSCRSARRGLDAGPGAAPGIRTDAGAGGVRRGRRDRGDLQRAAGRRVLRDGADPARLRRRVLRRGGAGQRHRRRRRARGAREHPFLPLPPSPCAARRVPALRRARRRGRASSGWASPGCCTGRGRLRLGVARPGVGAPRGRRLLLGGLLLALPQMYGVGYPVLENAVEGQYVIGFLLLLLVGKMVATSLTIGIGGSGGVFAPTLFIGAMVGAAFGTIAHELLPGVTASAGAYGLIGMGAAFAGAAGAPITAVIIMFELTGEYSIILPLMAAIVMAAGTGHCCPRTPSTPPNCAAAASTSTPHQPNTRVHRRRRRARRPRGAERATPRWTMPRPRSRSHGSAYCRRSMAPAATAGVCQRRTSPKRSRDPDPPPDVKPLGRPPPSRGCDNRRDPRQTQWTWWHRTSRAERGPRRWSVGSPTKRYSPSFTREPARPRAAQ